MRGGGDMTPAHQTEGLAELVCSNSFRSDDDERNAVGLLHWEMRAAGGLGERVARLADLRSAEGYMADWEPDGEGGYVLSENHCPICAAATACQNFCRAELAVFRDVLGPGATVERTDHIVMGARRCAYRISRAGD